MIFKTENEIYRDMIEHAVNTGLIHVEEDELERILSGEKTENQFLLDFATHAYIDGQLESQTEDIYESIDLNTAQGAQLDNIGRWFGMSRAQAQSAEVMVELDMEVNEEDTIVIPAGTPLVVDPAVIPLEDEYVTVEDLEITQGMTVGSVLCENSRMGFTRPLGEGAVRGFEDFPLVVASNSEPGTTGRDIESDDSFRQRILEWPTSNLRGTKTILDDYLMKREGVDGYKLVPRWNGPGTLKIIIDCLPELVDTIQQEVHEVCMDYKDDLPVMELPGAKILELLSFQIRLSDLPLGMTHEELKQLITNHVYCWINGGKTRNNVVLQGLSIGADFVPSQLLANMMNTFPEILNIQCNIGDIVRVPDNQKLDVEEILVGFI